MLELQYVQCPVSITNELGARHPETLQNYQLAPPFPKNPALPISLIPSGHRQKSIKGNRLLTAIKGGQPGRQAMDTRASGSGSGTASSRAYFEQQREALIGDIAEVRSLFCLPFFFVVLRTCSAGCM